MKKINISIFIIFLFMIICSAVIIFVYVIKSNYDTEKIIAIIKNTKYDNEKEK